jgi:8-oxo-dGTP diphosphatase
MGILTMSVDFSSCHTTSLSDEEPIHSWLNVVTVALIDTDDRILVSRRRADQSFAGMWEFPGGKVQENERPEQALIRELSEELGIQTFSSCLAPLSFSTDVNREGTHLLLLLYICRQWAGTPCSLEGQELKWVRLSELRTLAMPPADKPFIAMLNHWL